MSRSDIETQRAHSCVRKSEMHCLYCNSAYLPRYNSGDVCSVLLKPVYILPECHVMLFYMKDLHMIVCRYCSSMKGEAMRSLTMGRATSI